MTKSITAGSSTIAHDFDPHTESAPRSKLRAANDPDGMPRAMRLVYLLSQYPAVSHTFFLNEIRALRSLGITIEVASINRPDRPFSSMPAGEQQEAEKTFYIKSAGIAWAVWI